MINDRAMTAATAEGGRVMNEYEIKWRYSSITLAWHGMPGNYCISRYGRDGRYKYVLTRRRDGDYPAPWLGRASWIGCTMNLTEAQNIAEQHAESVCNSAKEHAA